MVLKISQKGWVVIPAELRRKYNLKPDDEVHVVDYGGVLSLIPASKNPIKQGRGILKGETSLVDALLAERKREQVRER